MAGNASRLEKVGEQWNKPKIKWTPPLITAAAAAVILIVVLFVCFVPVRLVATYTENIHENETISDATVHLTAQTLAHRSYQITHFTKNAETAGDTPTVVTLRWGFLTADMTLTPVLFDHYTVSYGGVYYQKGTLDPAALEVHAVFEDGADWLLEPDTYNCTVRENETTANLTVGSVFGAEPAGEIPMIRFRECRFIEPTVHEGDAIRAQDCAVAAVYEDDTEQPLEESPVLSGEIAMNTTQISVESRFGSFSEPVRYIPIASVEPNDDYSAITVTYADGKAVTVTPADRLPDFVPPQIVSCTIEGENTVVELDADENTGCVYAAFISGENGIVGSSLGASYGSGRVRITLPYKSDQLLQQFRVISVCGDALTQLSNSRYITNPEAAAGRTFAYPVQSSKKGLQIEPGRMSDVRELGVRHAVVNLPLDKLIGSGYSYNFNGSTYSFNLSYIRELDSQFKALGDAGIVTTAVLLMRFTSGSSELVYPVGRIAGHNYYGLNMTNAAARNRLAAMFSMLAERYSTEQYKVYNWILGNEVANFREWNYCGSIAFEDYIRNYATSFRLLYNCAKSAYSGCHALISLDNCWNFTRRGAFTGHEVLDAFAKELQAEGDIDWWVAYHAYSEPLTNTAFWNPNNRVTKSVDNSQMITIMNLKVLTDYVKETYGEEHKFILSENGFSSSHGQDVQAAAIAYAYKLAEANDMVDSIDIHRHVDNGTEMAQGLYLGLRSSGGGAKQAWSVYKNMDTDPDCADFALNVIGGSSWEELLAKAGF